MKRNVTTWDLVPQYLSPVQCHPGPRYVQSIGVAAGHFQVKRGETGPCYCRSRLGSLLTLDKILSYSDKIGLLELTDVADVVSCRWIAELIWLATNK
jgi:hypothetical protein